MRDEDRLKRKEQVQRIQNLIATIDSLLPKVHDLATIVVFPQAIQKPGPFRREQKGKQKEGQVPKALSSTEADAAHAEELEEEEEEEVRFNALQQFERDLERRIQHEIDYQSGDTEFSVELETQYARLDSQWKRLKMNIHMMVDESDSEYTLSTFLPGLKKENISITSNKEGLSPIMTISGFLGPTLIELALLRRQLVRTGNPPEDQLLLRLGQGRYGTFREKYALPLDVDINDIDATFDGGAFAVTLPKVRLLHATQPFEKEVLW